MIWGCIAKSDKIRSIADPEDVLIGDFACIDLGFGMKFHNSVEQIGPLRYTIVNLPVHVWSRRTYLNVSEVLWA